jgi:transcriptional regulator with XRE-family HTH domain
MTPQVMAAFRPARYRRPMTAVTTRPTTARPVGELLREWRERRRLSQLELSLQAEISTRHLSFVETGRSRPTPEMIMRLAEQLDVPLRDRNTLLLAGGYAPAFAERSLDEPALAAVRAALRQVLAGHEPYPAVVVNRWWKLVDGNASVGLLTAGAAEWLLEPPINVLRLSLHPDGMAPRIVNLAEWRSHLLSRLLRQAQASGDQRLAALHEELLGYPGGTPAAHPATDVVVPLRYRAGDTELSFFSITAVFGTPLDVTVDELAIESFYPADEQTAAALHGHAAR